MKSVKIKNMNGYRQNHKSRGLFCGLFALLMLLVSVRYVFQIDFPAVVLLGLMVFMICIGDRSEVLAVCAACIPLTSALTHDYVLLAAIIALLLKDQGNIRIDLTILPVLMLIVWELLHSLVGEFSAPQLVVMFAPLLLCTVLLWMDLRDIDYSFIVRVLAVSTCVMCLTLMGMLLMRSGFSLSRMFANMHRLGLQTEGRETVSLTMNPNSLAIICILAVSGLMQLALTGERKRTDLLMMITMLVCGALTLSRTYLVLLVIMVILFGFFQKRGLTQMIRFFVMLLLTVLLAALVLNAMFPTILEQYLGRFQVSDISGGRSSLFASYHEYILSDPKVMFWGIGLADYTERIMIATHLPNIPHNGIQEVITAWGIPGLIILVVFFLSLPLQAKKKAGKIYFVQYIPLILLIAKAQAGQLLKSDYTMLAFTFAYLSLSRDFTAVASNRLR